MNHRHLYAYNSVWALKADDMPIGVCGGSRVQLGKESKARKQFAATYGRETLQLQVFGKGQRVSEGEFNAKILSNLALQGPAWPYEIWSRVEAKPKKGHRIPDSRTFRRHIQELSELGYIKPMKQEPHHAGTKRTYTLTEKGHAVVLFLPEVRRNLLKYLDLYRAATPGGKTIRLLLKKDILTLPDYMIRATNAGMLVYNFEEEQDEETVRNTRLTVVAGVLLNLAAKARRGEPLPQSISKDDAMKFDDALKKDPEFRRSAMELIQGMKEELDHARNDAESILSQLKELDSEVKR